MAPLSVPPVPFARPGGQARMGSAHHGLARAAKPARLGAMRTALDTHVHLHPFYDLAHAFAAARDVLLGATGSGGAAGLCLTEASGCRAFEALRDGRLAAPGWSVEAAADGLTLRLAPAAGGEGLWIVAGRQIVTRERIEVLALGCGAEVPDGLAAEDAVGRAQTAGALPVLPWAPGKWFGGRGRRVAALMDRFGPSALVLADTALRPVGWPTPVLIRRGLREGFRVLAGSDPLPLPREERRIGRYATVVDGLPHPHQPAASILRLVGPGGPPLQAVGRRPCLSATALRLFRHARAKRASRSG